MVDEHCGGPEGERLRSGQEASPIKSQAQAARRQSSASSPQEAAALHLSPPWRNCRLQACRSCLTCPPNLPEMRFVDFKERVDKWFKVSERGSTIETEIKAGLASFLTMSYILLVRSLVADGPGTTHITITLSTNRRHYITIIIVNSSILLPSTLNHGPP